MLTMRPARAAIIGASAACVHRNTPVRLTASMRSQAVVRQARQRARLDRAGVVDQRLQRAALGVHLGERARHAGGVGDVELDAIVRHALGDRQRHAHLLERRARASRERHVPARARERLRDGRADAARGAGHQHARAASGAAPAAPRRWAAGRGPARRCGSAARWRRSRPSASARSPLRMSWVMRCLRPRVRAGRWPPAAAWPSGRARASSRACSRCARPR